MSGMTLRAANARRLDGGRRRGAASQIHRSILLLQQPRPTQCAHQADVAHRQNRKRKQYGDRRAENAVDGDEGRVEVETSGVFHVVVTGRAGVGARRPDAERHQVTTRHRHGRVVPEPRQVEYDRTDKHRRDGDARSTDADEATSVERFTDGDVASDGHDDSQPRAADEQHVDETFVVHVEVERKQRSVTRVEHRQLTAHRRVGGKHDADASLDKKISTE